MFPANVDNCAAVKLPFTMSSLAVSQAFVIGLTSAMPLSHDGNVPRGNMALLMKIKGNARKLTIATSESTLFH